MVFLETRLLDDWQTRWWHSNLTISHVCRRWRQQALALALLWDELRWAHGKRVDAALTVLQRSRRAPILVQLDMIITAEVASDIEVAAARTIARAVFQDLDRICDLDVTLTGHFVDADVLSPICALDPVAMPRLRSLSVDYLTLTPEDLRLNITARDLSMLRIQGCFITAGAQLVGPSTTVIHIGGFEMHLSQLVQLLNAAPNLASLSIGAHRRPTTIVDDMTPEDVDLAVTALIGAMKHVTMVDVRETDAHSLLLLGILLPLDTVPHISLLQGQADVLEEEWIRFLRVPALGDVEELSISGNGQILNFSAADGAKARGLYCERALPFYLLPLFFIQHPILVSLQVLSLELLQWKKVMEIVEMRGAHMPSLWAVYLGVDPSIVAASEPSLGDYTGLLIHMPALELLRIRLWRGTPLSLAAARHLLVAVHPLIALLQHGSIELRGDRETRDAFLSRCVELFRDDARGPVGSLAGAFSSIVQLSNE